MWDKPVVTIKAMGGTSLAIRWIRLRAPNAGDPGLILGSGRSAEEGIGYPLQYSRASLVAQLVKNPPAMQKTGFNTWVGKIPWRRERLPSPVFWPGEFHGLYNPWGHEKSDTTERLSLTYLLAYSVFRDVER